MADLNVLKPTDLSKVALDEIGEVRGGGVDGGPVLLMPGLTALRLIAAT